MERRCLYCYEPLAVDERDFHPKCSRKMFGWGTPPHLPFQKKQMEELLLDVVRSRTCISGVQPKLVLKTGPSAKDRAIQQFGPAASDGGFILKLPIPGVPQICELEDLAMHMAEAAGIDTVPHCLVRMRSGSPAFLTRRIDRLKKGKRHMEDMCQITGRLTEGKYQGSYEQIAEALRRHSANPGLDVINFFEVVQFGFLTGNADMHLKHFSLIDMPERGGFSLAPVCELLPMALFTPSGGDDLALTLNGKKQRITFEDFVAALEVSSVDGIVQERMFRKFRKVLPAWESLIERSFLDRKMQKAYRELIMKKFRQIGLDS
ncbi:MAG: HipA domain-containing protein [Chlorobiaceae bacterium]|nr:HipA domain-containing protein [Chlorobiaceae bacterium]